MSTIPAGGRPSIYYTVDLTRLELMKARDLVRDAITRTVCPIESRILDDLFNALNVDKRG